MAVQENTLMRVSYVNRWSLLNIPYLFFRSDANGSFLAGMPPRKHMKLEHLNAAVGCVNKRATAIRNGLTDNSDDNEHLQ